MTFLPFFLYLAKYLRCSSVGCLCCLLLYFEGKKARNGDGDVHGCNACGEARVFPVKSSMIKKNGICCMPSRRPLGYQTQVQQN